MNQLEHLKQALDYVEEHLEDEIDYGAIARQAPCPADLTELTVPAEKNSRKGNLD